MPASCRNCPCTPLGAALHHPPQDQPCKLLEGLQAPRKAEFFSPRSSTSARTFALSSCRSPGWSFQPGRGVQPAPWALWYRHTLSTADCRGARAWFVRRDKVRPHSFPPWSLGTARKAGSPGILQRSASPGARRQAVDVRFHCSLLCSCCSALALLPCLLLGAPQSDFGCSSVSFPPLSFR